MSNSRHGLDRHVLVRSFAVTFAQSRPLKAPASPDWHQLIYATRGVVTVRTSLAAWVAPPHRAVWAPAGEAFDLQLTGPVALRTLYFRRVRRLAALPATCAVVNVTPLLRELIVRVVEGASVLDRRNPRDRRLADVLIDEVTLLQAVPLQLPLPQDPRALRFAEAWQSNGAPVAGKALWKKCGASRRTLERLFAQETAMSLGQWTRRERLLRALRALAAGGAVGDVAAELGYSSASAFVAMFRRELGVTPGRYFA